MNQHIVWQITSCLQQSTGNIPKQGSQHPLKGNWGFPTQLDFISSALPQSMATNHLPLAVRPNNNNDDDIFKSIPMPLLKIPDSRAHSLLDATGGTFRKLKYKEISSSFLTPVHCCKWSCIRCILLGWSSRRCRGSFSVLLWLVQWILSRRWPHCQSDRRCIRMAMAMTFKL